jgi:O-antigen/teichoic acid export membrane protein
VSHPLKRLLTQTAIYGLSTIVVRMLNFLLAPLHTRVFLDQSDYGIISEMYAYVTFLNVVFMYGMETAFFRFASGKEPLDHKKVFGSAQGSLLITTIVFTGILMLWSGRIANWLQYPEHPEYILYFAGIIALDTLVNIPFARLRLASRPWRYFAVKLGGIGVNVLLNLFFLLPALLNDHDLFNWLGYTYSEDTAVAKVFIANLCASAVVFLVFLPGWKDIRFDPLVWKKLMAYGTPLVLIGLAGMVNETFDRILLKYLLPGTVEENLAQVGIYSAVYKISIFMTLAVQAFRMGAEPFFFQQSSSEKAPLIYALVMKYFVIVCCIIFLGVGLFPDVFRIIIGEAYHSGLHIVPILLFANLLLGVYYNQSVWYKLTDKTLYATLIPVAGALLSIGANVILIPVAGYTGAAWARLLCYGSMVVLSYWIGQKYYPVPYPLRKIGGYAVLSVLFCLIGLWAFNSFNGNDASIALRFVLLGLFMAFAWWLDGSKLRRGRM